MPLSHPTFHRREIGKPPIVTLQTRGEVEFGAVELLLASASHAACADRASILHASNLEDVETIHDLTTGVAQWSPPFATDAPPGDFEPPYGSWFGALAWNPLLEEAYQAEQPVAGCSSKEDRTLLLSACFCTSPMTRKGMPLHEASNAPIL